MKKTHILKLIELLLVIITFLYNFSPVIYHKLTSPHIHKPVLFQSCRCFNVEGRMRNVGWSLLIVTFSEAGQLIRLEQK